MTASDVIPLVFLLLAAYVAWVPTRFGAPTSNGTSHALQGFRIAWLAWVIAWGAAALSITLELVAVPQNLRFLLLFVAPSVIGTLLVLGVPPVQHAVARLPLLDLVRWQRFRMVGGFFIIGAALGQLPWTFALIAGTGDILIGITALVTARQMQRSPDRATALAKRHAWFGLSDFVLAVSTAFATKAQLGWPYALIPLFLVPIAILGHVVTLRRPAAAKEVSLKHPA
jgi:hypothetical protein